jgi:bifunctional DNase/RNase
MNKIALEIITIAPSVAQNQSYAVILGEIKGKRRLPIVIGMSEAQAIAMAMENMTPGRPLTHDLIKNILTTFDTIIKEVLINNLLEGVFYAQLICDKDGEEYIIDSRTSDALAMAVRFGCPIYIYSHIMDSAGMEYVESGDEDESEEPQEMFQEEEPSDYGIYTSKELDALLKEALENEDYEKAARVRDEMKRRAKN